MPRLRGGEDEEGSMTDDKIMSLREWLASWGDGPNWVDPEHGRMVPIT